MSFQDVDGLIMPWLSMSSTLPALEATCLHVLNPAHCGRPILLDLNGDKSFWCSSLAAPWPAFGMRVHN
ncbi:hypothetical protein ACVIM8_001855 [Bradyrhizobium sp. USDA 4529]